jgi:hypothetical protein
MGSREESDPPDTWTESGQTTVLTESSSSRDRALEPLQRPVRRGARRRGFQTGQIPWNTSVDPFRPRYLEQVQDDPRTGRIVRVTSETIAAWISTTAAIATAGAACMAWMAARASSGAARDLTALEAARRHEELTPTFSVRVEPFNPGDVHRYRLVLELDGPLALEGLETLLILVRDDRPGRDAEEAIGNEATPELVRAQVWGPLRFSLGLRSTWSASDQTGREAHLTRFLDVGEGHSWQMEPTTPPPWYHHGASNEAVWRRDAGSRLRLRIVAQSESNGSWSVPIEVDLVAEGVDGFAAPSVS